MRAEGRCRGAWAQGSQMHGQFIAVHGGYWKTLSPKSAVLPEILKTDFLENYWSFSGETCGHIVRKDSSTGWTHNMTLCHGCFTVPLNKSSFLKWCIWMLENLITSNQNCRALPLRYDIQTPAACLYRVVRWYPAIPYSEGSTKCSSDQVVCGFSVSQLRILWADRVDIFVHCMRNKAWCERDKPWWPCIQMQELCIAFGRQKN